ncbi:hypothetical protein ACFX1R_020951 [Malus domestica]
MTLGRENEAAQHWVAGCCFRQISVDSSGRLGSDRLQKRTAQYGMQAVCLLHSHGPREKKNSQAAGLLLQHGPGNRSPPAAATWRSNHWAESGMQLQAAKIKSSRAQHVLASSRLGKTDVKPIVQKGLQVYGP